MAKKQELIKMIVNTPSVFEIDDSFEDDRFVKIKVAVMHSGINRNNSRFSTKVIKEAKNTFANIPILADIIEYEDENGNTYLDYGSHDFHIEDDFFNEGQKRVIYDEKIVGLIPETNDFEIVHDNSTGNDYVYVTAWLYRDYGNYACDVLESRGGKTDVSAEIICEETSYSAKDKCLDVGKMCMSGVTLLGEKVTPGMAKAHAEMFSEEKTDINTQVLTIMQELTEALANYTNAVTTANNTTKGGNNQVFEQLLEKYGKAIEDITFDYESMSDEELEVAFASAFAEESEGESEEEENIEAVEETSEGTEETTETESEQFEETEEEAEETTEEAVETQEEVEETEVPDEETEEVAEDKFAMKYSIALGETKKDFAVSLSDVMYSFTELVNDTYGDDGYYSVEVYADDNYIIMTNWYDYRSYKQAFKKRKDSYQLVGDRVPVKAVYVTEDEEKKLDEMRSNYSTIVDKLEKYEIEPEKVELLNSDAYKIISDTKEFVELQKVENHFDLSVDEITESLNKIIIKYATSGKLDFGKTAENTTVQKKIFTKSKVNTESGRYAGMFRN